MKRINLFIAIPCSVAILTMIVATIWSFPKEDKFVEWTVSMASLAIVLYTLVDFPLTRTKVFIQIIPFALITAIFNPFIDLHYKRVNLNDEAQGYLFIVVFFLMLVGMFNDDGTQIAHVEEDPSNKAL